MPQQTVEYWIANNTIVELRKLIRSETDESTRSVLRGLLKREVAKRSAEKLRNQSFAELPNS
jgi:hypothetical protein